MILGSRDQRPCPGGQGRTSGPNLIHWLDHFRALALSVPDTSVSTQNRKMPKGRRNCTGMLVKACMSAQQLAVTCRRVRGSHALAGHAAPMTVAMHTCGRLESMQSSLQQRRETKPRHTPAEDRPWQHAAITHIQFHIVEKEDGGERRCCAEDGDSRCRILDPLLKLIEQTSCNEGAQEDADDLRMQAPESQYGSLPTLRVLRQRQ